MTCEGHDPFVQAIAHECMMSEDRNGAITQFLRETLFLYTKMRRVLVRDMQAKGLAPPMRYASTEEMVLFTGTPKATRITECRYPPMQAGNCFGNAFQLTLEDPTLTYVEGWACMEQSFPTHHGWVEDANGNIHDPTWLTLIQQYKADPNHVFGPDYQARCVYWGVRVPRPNHLAWFHKHETPNILAFGEMSPREVLHYGMDAFNDVTPNEEGAIALAWAALASTSKWVLNARGTGYERRNNDGTVDEWYP